MTGVQTCALPIYEQGVHTPSFLGYVFRYTLPFMIPMLVLVWAIFFR